MLSDFADFGTNIPDEICNKTHLYSLLHLVLYAETILCKTSRTAHQRTSAPRSRDRRALVYAALQFTASNL